MNRPFTGQQKFRTLYGMKKYGSFTKIPLIAALLLTPFIPVQAASTPEGGSAVDETQKTVSAVTAVDNHWLLAEVHGDVAWLDHMLLPEYRSVGSNGSISPKAKILASARRNQNSDKMARLVAKYMKEHPTGTSVVLKENTAVVTFYSKKIGPKNGIRSSDIFVYINGAWHAIYSQHTAMKT